MKNIVLCFDRTTDSPDARPTNVGILPGLLTNDGTAQVLWYHPGRRPAPMSPRWRAAALAQARAAITEAYGYLRAAWRPGDRIALFGVGPGAYCARALTRLLGTVGLMDDLSADLRDYILATHALSHTARTDHDWQRVARVAQALAGRRDIAVPVGFLGLWDCIALPGLCTATEPLPTVAAGRHAVAIDGTRGPLTGRWADCGREPVEQVWLRGAHHDVTGGPGAYRALADIAFDWVLAGAERAGVLLDADRRCAEPSPSETDALAGSARGLTWRRMPPDASVHASVEVYLRAHPEYWRRLPARVCWADRDWLARGERLMPAPERTTPAPAPAGLVATAR